MAQAKKQTEVSGFHDSEGIRSYERPERFDPDSPGTIYRVRILTHPIKYVGARVENIVDPTKSFWTSSAASLDDMRAGNWEAVDAMCPLFRRGIIPHDYRSIADSFIRRISLVMVIAKRSTTGKETRVMQAYPWVFNGPAWRSIHAIAAELGDGDDIRNHELSVQCTDAKYKKLEIHKLDSTKYISDFDQCIAAARDYFNTEEGYQSQDPESCECILASIEPEPMASLEKSIARAFGQDENGDGEMIVSGAGKPAPGRASGKPGKGSAIKPKAPEPEPVEVDFEALMDGDDEPPVEDAEPEAEPEGDPEPESEAEEPPPARSASRPAIRPGPAKPAAASTTSRPTSRLAPAAPAKTAPARTAAPAPAKASPRVTLRAPAR